MREREKRLWNESQGERERNTVALPWSAVAKRKDAMTGGVPQGSESGPTHVRVGGAI